MRGGEKILLWAFPQRVRQYEPRGACLSHFTCCSGAVVYIKYTDSSGGPDGGHHRTIGAAVLIKLSFVAAEQPLVWLSATGHNLGLLPC